METQWYVYHPTGYRNCPKSEHSMDTGNLPTGAFNLPILVFSDVPDVLLDGFFHGPKESPTIGSTDVLCAS